MKTKKLDEKNILIKSIGKLNENDTQKLAIFFHGLETGLMLQKINKENEKK